MILLIIIIIMKFINLINRALDRAIRRSNAVDLENLCIIAEKSLGINY